MSGYEKNDTVASTDEELLLFWYKRIGVALIVGFFFPIYMGDLSAAGDYGLPNILMLGKSGLVTDIGLAYPLLAGLIVLFIINRTAKITRPIVLFTVSVLPLLLITFYGDQLAVGGLKEILSEASLLYIILMLIGLYAGSRVVAVSTHISGRLVAGIGGLGYLVLSLVPLGKESVPIYFRFFRILRGGAEINIPGSVIVMGIAVVVMFSVYIHAAFLALLNLQKNPGNSKTGLKIARLVFFPSFSFPVAIILIVLFSGADGAAKGEAFSFILKILFIGGGIIFLLALSLRDLLAQCLDEPLPGLMEEENKLLYPGQR
ncbi:MAG: hypothetical protein GY757_10750 [bacterium]|nr:hypothetical protein [bacterium]